MDINTSLYRKKSIAIQLCILFLHTLHSQFHGWPFTQRNRITHNLAGHLRAAHNPAARWHAGSVVCNLPRWKCRLAQRWPSSVPSSRRCANVSPTYIVFWLVRLWRVLPIQVIHTTEPAHDQATGAINNQPIRCSNSISCTKNYSMSFYTPPTHPTPWPVPRHYFNQC